MAVTRRRQIREWRYYGGDAGSTKYSPLDQINAGNVKNLQARLVVEGEELRPAARIQLGSDAR